MLALAQDTIEPHSREAMWSPLNDLELVLLSNVVQALEEEISLFLLKRRGIIDQDCDGVDNITEIRFRDAGDHELMMFWRFSSLFRPVESLHIKFSPVSPSRHSQLRRATIFFASLTAAKFDSHLAVNLILVFPGDYGDDADQSLLCELLVAIPSGRFSGVCIYGMETMMPPFVIRRTVRREEVVKLPPLHAVSLEICSNLLFLPKLASYGGAQLVSTLR